jgi:hypothetical protein
MGSMMAYLKDLENWLKKNNKTAGNRAHVNFLKEKKHIKEAIEAGYSVKIIWEHLIAENRIVGTYSTFTKNVKRYIKQDSLDHLEKSIEKIESSIDSSLKEDFLFNPKARKEDLI